VAGERLVRTVHNRALVGASRLGVLGPVPGWESRREYPGFLSRSQESQHGEQPAEPRGVDSDSVVR